MSGLWASAVEVVDTGMAKKDAGSMKPQAGSLGF